MDGKEIKNSIDHIHVSQAQFPKVKTFKLESSATDHLPIVASFDSLSEHWNWNIRGSHVEEKHDFIIHYVFLINNSTCTKGKINIHSFKVLWQKKGHCHHSG